MESVKNVLEGKRSIRAEELLFMESTLGIHRDEILGKISDTRVQRKSLKQLDEWFIQSRKEAETDGNELASKLNLLINAIQYKMENELQIKQENNFAKRFWQLSLKNKTK